MITNGLGWPFLWLIALLKSVHGVANDYFHCLANQLLGSDNDGAHFLRLEPQDLVKGLHWRWGLDRSNADAPLRDWSSPGWPQVVAKCCTSCPRLYDLMSLALWTWWKCSLLTATCQNQLSGMHFFTVLSSVGLDAYLLVWFSDWIMSIMCIFCMHTCRHDVCHVVIWLISLDLYLMNELFVFSSGQLDVSEDIPFDCRCFISPSLLR